MATVIVHNECSPWKSYAVNTRLEIGQIDMKSSEVQFIMPI